MRKNETNPLLRRVYGVVRLDDGVTLATDADVGPPVGALQVTVNGAAPATATGVFAGDGSGEYYYQFSAAEVAADAFVAFKFERAGFQTEWFIGEVGDTWLLGETDPTRLRQPIVIFDDSSPPALASATVTVASQLQTSTNSVTFADASGTLHFVAAGLHYYQGTTPDAAVEGTLLVRFAKAGYQTEVAWAVVSPAEVTAVPPPSLTSLTPSADVDPGDSSGFSASVVAASQTPVVAVVANGAVNLELILVTFVVDGVEEIAYYGGALRGRYVSRSSQLVSGSDLTLSLLRDAGWSRTAGHMTLTIEGVPPEIFNMRLPSTTPQIAAAAEVTAPVGIDHTSEMMLRLPSQFQGKPRIAALVRVLGKSIQRLSDALDYVEAHYDVDTAFGHRLRVLARRVHQPVDGVTDDDLLRRLVRARVATNKSSGTVNQLIRIIRLIIDSPSTDVTVEDRRIATVVVRLLDASTTTELATTLLKFLRQAKVSAVRLRIVYTQTDPVFRFNSGPGFNVGHLASSVE